MSPKLVQPYDTEWPAWFARLREVLESALDGAHLRIEHVGSTAVPGLSAKPIVDLDVVVAAGRFEEIAARLGRLGYEHRGDQGVADREVFRLADGEPLRSTLPPHHLYVCVEDSRELRRHLHLRERLRRDPALRDDYGRRKMLLAEACGHDRKEYARRKETALVDFFARILRDVEDGSG